MTHTKGQRPGRLRQRTDSHSVKDKVDEYTWNQEQHHATRLFQRRIPAALRISLKHRRETREGTRGVSFGCISRTEPTGHIHVTAARIDSRKQGVGAGLHQMFVRKATAMGCKHIKAITNPSNSESISFHQAIGMRLLGEVELIEKVCPSSQTTLVPVPIGWCSGKTFDGFGGINIAVCVSCPYPSRLMCNQTPRSRIKDCT